MFCCHFVAAFGICRHQCLVCEYVDSPCQAAGCFFDGGCGFLVENIRPLVTHTAQAKVEVRQGIFRRKRLQIKIVRDALLQLAYMRLRQFFVQLGLTEQHHLQQFAFIGFQVAEQADFFQRFHRHALRFFHEHHHRLAFRMFLQKVILQFLHHVQLAGVAVNIQTEFVRNHVQDIVWRQTGVGDVDHINLVGQSHFQHAAQHGFAAANFPHHLDNAFATGNGVGQRIQRCASLAAFEKQAGVGRDFERRPFESEMLQIHYVFPSFCTRL